MSTISANFGQLDGTQQQIMSNAASMNQQLSDLKSYLQPMVSTWDGSASESYQQLQRKWDQAAAELNQILHQIGTATGNANDGFQAAERSNAQRFAG